MSEKKRIIGIDVARALAVIGMIIVNFKIVFGDNGEGWLKDFANFFSGKAAATFVVLAGIGLALMTNTAVRNSDTTKLRIARKRILKRSLFLFVVGLSYMPIWPADILHYYGIYMLIVLLFIKRSSLQILISVLGFVFLYPLLLMLFDYEKGWLLTTLTYTDFWTIEGFFRNLFINGFHPVFPWVAFMLFGLWYGKQNLHDKRFLKISLGLGLAVFICINLLSIGLINFLSGGNTAIEQELAFIIGTEPMPPLPIYMLSGLSIATVIISACILVAQKYENSWLILALNRTGKLALTFYVAHVIIGMGVIEIFMPQIFYSYSIYFSIPYAFLFSLLCILFASIWMRYKKSGPLEWVMRKLTD